MTLRQQAVRATLWSAVQKWGTECISFVSFVALSRLLEPQAFGLVALASVFTLFLKVFLDQGFSTAIVQRDELEQAHLDTAFWICVATGTASTVCTLAVSGAIASFFGEPALTPVLRVLSLSFVFGAFSSTQIAILQRELAFRSLAIRSVTAAFAGGVVGVTMAIAGGGVWSLVAQNLTSVLVGAIVLWRSSPWRPRLCVSKAHFQDLFGFGVSVVAHNGLKYVVRRADHLLIGYYLGPVLLGYYTIGYRLLLVLMRLVTGVSSSVALPTFSRLQGDVIRLRRAFYAATRYTSLLACPVFLGLAVLAPEIVLVLFGDQWQPSVPVIRILALVGLLQSLLFFNGSVMRACGKPSWQLAIMLLNAAASVGAFFVAVRWGITAVAASLAIVSYLLAPLTLSVTRRLIHLEPGVYLREVAAPLFASLVMLLGVFVLRYYLEQQTLSVYLKLSIYILAGVVMYSALIAVTAPSLSRQITGLVAGAFPKGSVT